MPLPALSLLALAAVSVATSAAAVLIGRKARDAYFNELELTATRLAMADNRSGLSGAEQRLTLARDLRHGCSRLLPPWLPPAEAAQVTGPLDAIHDRYRDAIVELERVARGF